MIIIFRGNSPAMLRTQETDAHGFGALKPSLMPLLTAESCSSCLLKLRLRPSCGRADYRLLWLLYPKLALPDSPHIRA